MYNVSNGEKPLGKSEILEPLHSCLRELLEYEKKGKLPVYKYSDEDVICITLLYSLIMGNRLMNILTEEKASVQLAQDIGNSYGTMLRQLTLGMSRVNTTAYFKSGGNK